MWWFLRRVTGEGGFVGPKEDPTDAAVEEDEDGAPSQGKSVQVDLSDKGEGDKSKEDKTPPADAPKKAASNEAEERRLRALESQIAASRRVNEDLRKQLQDLNQKLQPPKQDAGAHVLPKGTSQETIDKYDQLVADGKWQEAVRILSREEYKASRDVELAQERIRTIEERRLNALERSKQMVEGLYPTLHRETGDEAAIETQLFNEAVRVLAQEDDQFIHDPYAPQLAMHRMEQLARDRGVKLNRATVVQGTPAQTPGRVGRTSMPASRGSGGATSYTLSPDQKEWCDANLSHLPEGERYKHYARFAKMAEVGGVEA